MSHNIVASSRYGCCNELSREKAKGSACLQLNSGALEQLILSEVGSHGSKIYIVKVFVLMQFGSFKKYISGYKMENCK